MPVNLKPGPSGPGGYRMAAKGDRGEIYIYGPIGQDWYGDGISARRFSDDLKALGNVKNIDLRINSEGGSVFDAKAMYTLLVAHSANIVSYIDGLAASAASYLAMAANEIKISESAFMMIHNAQGGCYGGAEDMRRCANLLETVNGSIRDIYCARTKCTSDQVKKWMDDETWFTGAEAIQYGFADSMVENMRVAAQLRDPSRFHNTPSALIPKPNLEARMSRITAMQDFAAKRGIKNP